MKAIKFIMGNLENTKEKNRNHSYESYPKKTTGKTLFSMHIHIYLTYNFKHMCPSLKQQSKSIITKEEVGDPQTPEGQ